MSAVAAAPKKAPWHVPWRKTASLETAASGVACGVLGSVAYAAGAKRNRSPLREGSAAKAGSGARAAELAVVGFEVKREASGVQASVGEDTLGVRRSTEPEWKAKRIGCRTAAAEALRSEEAEAEALKELDKGVFANSSVGPREKKWKTMGRIAAGAARPFSLVPLTVDGLRTLAAALKKGGYRTADKYLGLAKSQHVRAGFPWTDLLQLTLREATRSVMRGIGPANSAQTFGLERLASLERKENGTKGGPVALIPTGICMALWMLRGAEAAALLGEQVEADSSGLMMSIDLGPTKCDPAGRGCRRTLVCVCDQGLDGIAVAGGGVCPVHALREVLADRTERGWSPKHPLSGQASGKATSAVGVAKSFAKLLGIKITEHSFRREGAQFYTRHGVEEAIVMWIGRWGSEAVRRYIANALAGQAAAAAARATRASWKVSPGGLSEGAFSDVKVMLDVVKAALVDGHADSAEAMLVKAAKVAEATVRKEMPMLMDAAANEKELQCTAVAKIRSSTCLVPKVHLIAMGGLEIPSSLWHTKCGRAFGNWKHRRLNAKMADCQRCLKADSKYSSAV